MRLVSSSSIQVTTPPNIGGSTNILVVNNDGTWGTKKGGFAYSSLTPKLIGVSPSSGPPTTLITITGSDLDERIQNLEVRFSGTVAKVVSASRARIEAIVPYGATTGPVTVSVSGQVAVWPSFTVTPVPVSRKWSPRKFPVRGRNGRFASQSEQHQRRRGPGGPAFYLQPVYRYLPRRLQGGQSAPMAG